ncbi:MAG: DUF192 domain-containing protein [Maribacter sp.]
MKVVKHLIFLSVVFTFLNACKEEPKKVIKTVPITFTKEGELTITKQKVDTLITKLDIEFAQSEYETQTGLMYRKSMKDSQGMLFIFPDERMHSFYMKNTEISLDIIYLKADLTIASFQENTTPMNETGLSSQVPIQYVLEVNAGLAEKWLLEVGDKIEYHKN